MTLLGREGGLPIGNGWLIVVDCVSELGTQGDAKQTFEAGELHIMWC